MSTIQNDLIFEELHEWLIQRGSQPKNVLMDKDCRYYINELVEIENGDYGAYKMDRTYLPTQFQTLNL